MITLYGSPGSVFVRKPRILLQEKGVNFKVDPINLYQYTNDEFKAASPLNKIPALRDGDFMLADSSAICAYIERQYPIPAFYPADAKEYGKALWFEEYADTVLFAAIAPCYYQTILVPLYHQRSPNEELIKQALSEKLPPVADYLESQVSDKKYLVGDRFTIADVAVASMFFNMYHSDFPLDTRKWPHLDRYLKQQFARPSFRSCVKDMEIDKDKIQRNVSA